MMDAQQPDWTTTASAMPGEEDADADISLPDAPNPNTPKDQSAGDREIVNEPDVVNDKEQSGNVALHTEDYSTKSVEELYAGLGLENKEYSDEEFQNELRRSAERIGWISDPVVFEQRKAEFNNSLNELQRRMLVQRAAAQVEQMKPPLAHQEVMPGLDATTAQEIADARNKRFDYLLHGESGKQGSPYTRAVSTQSGWVRSNQLIEQARHKDKSELDEITDKALNAMSSDPSQRFGSDEEAAIQLAAAMTEKQAQANGGHAKTPSERELEAYYAGPEDTYVEVDGQHDPHEEQLVRQKDAAFRAEVKRHQEGYTHGLRGYATDIEKDPLASADCPVYAIPRMVKGSVENELREKAKERSFKGDQPGLSSMLAVLDDLEANEYDRHLKNAIRIFGPERYEGYVLAWAKKYYTTIDNARVAVDNMIRNEIINQLGLKPSNNWEYLFGSVLNNTFVTQGLKALYGLEKGTRPDDFNYITAQQVAYRQYEDEHNNDWQDKLTQMAAPALTLVADAVTGGFFLAGKAAQLTSLLPRLFYASGEAASRSLMNSAIYRIFMGSLSGAANFATYEMQSMALQQLATGEYRKKHNFWSSLGHAGVSGAAKGMVFGTVGEAFGSLFSGVSGKMVYGVEAGKLLAETATFSAMGYLENGNLTFKDVGTNFGLALSGRASHADKLIKDIRSRANNDGIYGRKANYHKISEAEKDALVALGYGDVASALRGENISEPMLRRMQNQLEQMRLDKRVSWETIRCCDWVLNGRLNAVPGVRDKIIEADGKGGYTITAVDANGRAIMGSVHVTGTEARNKVLSSINHEIDKASWVENESKMQSSLIGRQLVETVREYAESTGEDAEALLKTYMTALGKDFDHKSLEPVETKVYETINALRSGKGQPTDIADTKETIGKRFGVDIDQAIKTEKSQRTKEQRAALAEYQEWLDGREDIIDLHQYRGPAIERPYYGPERGSFERKRELGDDEYTTEVEKWRGGVMLGKVVVVNSLDEVTDAKVRKQIEDGDASGNKSVPGWYDSKTDTAYIYAPHIIDGKDFNETMLHEVVSHKGLRGLLGEADYNKLLDKIWEDMSPSERKALEDYPGGEENESEVERTRRLADEWLAHRAQGVDVDGRNSIWQTAKRHVKDWLRRHGIDVYYSDYELENKLRESYRELAGKGRKTKTERGSEGEPRKEGPIIEGEPEHIHEDKPDDGVLPPDDGGTPPPEGVAAPPAAEGGETPPPVVEPPVERPTAAVGRVEGTPAHIYDWEQLITKVDAASLPVEKVQEGLELLEAEREQSHRYANGELAEEPSNWEYWAARDGLSEPTRQAEPVATEPPAGGIEQPAGKRDKPYRTKDTDPYGVEHYGYDDSAYDKAFELEKEHAAELDKLEGLNDEEYESAADEIKRKLPHGFDVYYDKKTGVSHIEPAEPTRYGVGNLHETNRKFKIGEHIQLNFDGRHPHVIVTRINENGKVVEAIDAEDGRTIIRDGKFLSTDEVLAQKKLPKGANAEAETMEPSELPMTEHITKMTDAWGDVTRVEVVGQNENGTTRVRLWFKNRDQRGVETDVDLRGPQPPETPTPPTEPTGDATTAGTTTDVTTERPAEVTGSADDRQMRDKLGELLGGDADRIADAQARVDEPEEVSADDLEHYADDASEADGDAVEPFPMKNTGGGRLSPDWERASVEQIVDRLMDKSVTENPYQEIEERIASATEKVKQIESEKPKGRVTNAKKEKELHDWQRRRDKAQSQLDKLRSAQTRYRHADMERNRQQAEAAKAEQQRTKRAIDNLVQHIDELDLRDWVAYQIASGSGKFKWKDKEYANGFGGGRTHGLGGHVGGDASAYDMYKRNGYIDEKNGEYPEEFAEHLWSDMPEGMRERYSSRDVLEAVLDVMKSGESRRSLLESLAKDYEQTAEEEFEREQAERDAAEEAEWLDNRRTQGLLDRRDADLASRAGAPELADDARADLLADAQARLNDPNASEFEKQAARTVLRYRQRDGRDGVTAQGTEGDGVRFRVRRAPNGKESNLDERQYDEVRTDNFKKWFGDWENDPEEASKVVDANGEPLVVYHQTNRKQYINRETGQNWDDLDWREREEWDRRSDEEWNDAWEEQDFYTFDNRHARQSVEYPGFFFSPRYDEYHEYGDRTIAAYLDMKNPAIDPDIPNAGVTDTAGRDAMESLMRQGYDGVIRTEDGVPYEYIVFRPEQIKSATENNGDFSRENGDIRLRLRGEHETGDRVRVRRDGMNDGRVRVDGLPGEWHNIDEAGRAMRLADPEHLYVPSDDGNWLEVHDWRDNEVWDIWRGKPGSKRYENWRKRTLASIHKQVPDYAKKLGLDVELIDNEADVPAGHEREKSWYDPETGKIHIVVPRHAAFDTSDVMSSLWHEGVSRHGLRKLVGGDNYDTFLDNVYATSDANIRAEIDRLAEEVTDGDRRAATEEYLSRLAEQMGFQYYKDDSVPVRSWMQRGLKTIRENFDKLCRSLGMFDISETLRDDDLRTLLYNSYNRMRAENQSAYAAAKRAERDDKEYVKAVKRGDIDTAMVMLHRKLAASEGIVGYAAAHGHGGKHREVSHRLKDSESGAIEQAARDMAQYVPKDAVLVPMPPHEGVVRKDTDTWLLAQELSRLTGAPVVAALRGRERESRYAAKQAGRKGLSADELGFYQDMELPDGKTPVFVDNVVGSGETAKAAVQAMGGRGMTLAYTKDNLGKPTEGLKNVTVTYDDAGNLIPLSQRFDVNKNDIRFRTRDDDERRDSEESKKLFDAAKNKFGVTDDIREAGCILPDGSMLDFSGRHELMGADDSFLSGTRTTDHRGISDVSFVYDQDGNEVETGIKTDMADFIGRGAIRIDNNAGSINLSMAPTREQEAVLRKLIANNDGNVWVDFGDGNTSEHYAEYSGAKATRVLGDIDRYYSEGIKPQGNTLFRVRDEEKEHAAVERLDKEGMETSKEGDIRFSYRFPLDDERRKKSVEDIMRVTGVSRRKATKWLKDVASLTSYIIGDPENYAGYTPDERYKAIKSNSDYPQGSVDFNNICRKRKDFTAIWSILQRENPDRIFTAEDLENIRQTMIEDGYEVACGLCFVEGRRKFLGEIAQDFIDNMKNGTLKPEVEKLLDGDTYVPTIEELLTPGGSDRLRAEHPKVYDAFVRHNNARGMQAGRLYENYAEYKREILDWDDRKVKAVNDAGGLRIFSFSDFEATHLLDIIQIIADCAARGVKIQGYTKVPSFAKAIRNTGLKINRSLIPKGNGIKVVDGKKVLDYDTTEGIDINDPDFLDETDNPNVGNILVGVNDEHIRLAMLDPFVDYIIGYHASGISEKLRRMKGIGNWVDYTKTQSDRDLATGKKADRQINIYTDVLQAAEAEGKPITNKREFVEKFLQVAKERGLEPRFSQFLDKDANGNYVYTEGYHKFLVDFKLFDKDGNIAPQEVVRPDVDLDYCKKILDDYARDAKVEKDYSGTLDKLRDKLGLAQGSDIQLRVRDDEHREMVEEARRRLEDPNASEFEKQAARAVIKAYGGGSDGTPGGGGPRFRIREPQKAIDDYERAVNSSGFQVTEALQDSMMGLKKLMQAIVGKDAKGKEKAIQDIAGFENAYLKENRLQSESVAQVDEYRTRYYTPLVKAVSALIGKGGKKHRTEATSELTDYMMAKHGLERNLVLAERDATEEFESDANKDGNGNYIRNYDDILAEKREKDYSGLTALTGKADVAAAEDAARQMVDDYEMNHDTTELWQRTKEATDATLDKLHDSGVLSDEAYNRAKTMFEYYIPLRGWDETTSDEVYGYLTGPDGPLNGNVFKHAEGRRSKADDPLATIMMMASDAIRQGNRNVMKQRFLTFVLNNPSDAVSVNRLWMQRDPVTDKWKPVFADLDPTDSPEVVRQKVEQFEQDMAQLAQQDPDNFKHGKQTENIPYKVVNGNIGEHRVLVKHNGQTYVMTINGNPRAAQALNGLTNPDTRANNFVGKTLGAFAKLNRVLSQLFTTYSPKFVVRNFARDMGYSIASSAFVKEGGEYGGKFVKNYAKVGLMGKLFSKWESGTLDRNDTMENLFYEFMHNGGETGFSAPKELKDYKKALDKELRKENSKTRQLLGSFGEFYLRANRAVENRARFAAFVTSMEMGRGVDRSIWDAKEVSVNFNKKGAGAKMFDNPDQTLAGKTAGLIGDGGRSLFVFWNASVQGLTNYGKTFKAHPVKATSHASLLAGLAYMMPQLMQAIFGDDDGYYDLPDYVRRNNICFRWSKDMPWITIPLSPEHAVSYAIGDIIAGIASGKKQYLNGEEIANDFAKEVSKALPLDFTEGGGGHWWLPSAIKPAYEAYEMNESWTGAPIANQTEWNKQAPEYQRVYKTASQPFVKASEWINDMTNSDEDSKGLINFNPSKLEYVFKGYGGGLATLLNDCVRMFDVAFGDAEFEAHDIPVAGAMLKSGNPTTKQKEMMRQYYHYRDDAEGAKWELKNREGDALERFKQTDRYERYLVWTEMSKDVDKLKKQMKDNPDLEAEYYAAVEKLVSAMREQHAGKRKPSQETITEVKESERKDSIEALTDKQVHDAMVPLSDNAPQDSVDVKREGIKRAYKSEGLSYSKPNDDAKNALAYERHATYDDIAEDTALKGRKDALKKSVGETFEKMGVKYKKDSAGWDWYAEDDASASIDEIKAYYQSHKAELDEYGILSWWFGSSKGSSGYIKKGFTDGKHDPDEVMKEYRETRKEVLARTKQR